MSSPIKKLTKIKKVKLCVNCKYSYLQNDHGTGFCKYEEPDAKYKMSHPKTIKEFDTCSHWEIKEIVNRKSK